MPLALAEVLEGPAECGGMWSVAMNQEDSRAAGDTGPAEEHASGSPKEGRRRGRRGGRGRSRGGRGREATSAPLEAGAFDDAPPVGGGAPAGGGSEGGDRSRGGEGRREGRSRGRRGGRRRREARGPRDGSAEALSEAPPTQHAAQATDATDATDDASRDTGGRGRRRKRTGRRRRGGAEDGESERSQADRPASARRRGAGEEGAESDRSESGRRREGRRRSGEEGGRSRSERRGRQSRDSRYDRDAIEITPRAPDPSVKTEKILLVNATDRDESRIALLVDGRLDEVFIEALDERSQAGNVFRGRVQNVEKGIGAAFVDLGRGVTGFLHATDLPIKEGEDSDAPVTEKLSPGDEVIVQITRDSIGRKGPALTGRVSIPGRYLVLMPFSTRSGISRRIPHGKERERVRKLIDQLVVPEGMGVILRTASDTTDLPALQADLEHLIAEWSVIQRKAAEPGQPGVLRGESDIAERSVRDIMPSDVTRIVVDKDDIAGHIHRLLRIWYPSAAAAAEEHAHVSVRQAAAAAEAPRGELAGSSAPMAAADAAEAPVQDDVPDEPDSELSDLPADALAPVPPLEPEPPPESHAQRMERLARVARAMPEVELHTDLMPLFHAYNVETQLEDAFRRTIRLPSGGSIVFDQTEALVAIDVNSGRLTDREDPESTALATNLEAVTEVARQLRLRDLGGLVVIDFIDLRERGARRQVEDALRDVLSKDRARIRLGRMGSFGLVQLSRQRIRQALTRITHEECPLCAGTGRRRHLSGVALRILREIQARIARSKGRGGVEVRAPREAVDWLKRYRSGVLRSLERMASGPITLAVDDRLAADGWAMKGVPPAGGAAEGEEFDADPA